MPETLGEKLRQAREERGISISEVAEQTRISSLYLESIENDDYRNLPGGIFNKGFVRSFAKYVGVNEQEALTEYTMLVAGSEVAAEPELKLYRPEVLTDDRPGASMMPTLIIAAVILAGMTTGILFLVKYLRQPAAEPPTANTATRPNTEQPAEQPANTQPAPVTNAPDMATLKVEFKTTTRPIRLAATTDGVKSDNVLAANSSVTFEPKESLTLNYNRWNATVVELLINGKTISLPAEPLNDPRAQRIEFTINKDNLAQIWESGSIGPPPTAPSTDVNANTAETRPSTPSTPNVTPYPTPYPTPLPGTVATPLPRPGRTPANSNTTRSQPTPRPTVIIVPRPVRTPER